jgi:16S rRNA (cytidine1402-2'-O)-methyltransferase
LPSDEFQFLGFLPEKAGARRIYLEKLAAMPRESAQTLIFYEAPHRILETLSDIEQTWGGLPKAVVARELTKIHEEFVRGTVVEVRHELAARDRLRGEITLLIEAPATSSASIGVQRESTERITDRIARLQAEIGIDEKEALKRLARELGRAKSELYRELQRERAARR